MLASLLLIILQRPRGHILLCTDPWIPLLAGTAFSPPANIAQYCPVLPSTSNIVQLGTSTSSCLSSTGFWPVDNSRHLITKLEDQYLSIKGVVAAHSRSALTSLSGTCPPYYIGHWPSSQGPKGLGHHTATRPFVLCMLALVGSHPKNLSTACWLSLHLMISGRLE